MKISFFFLILSLLFSCGKKKIVQLPQISQSEITEIHDVSAGYIFYDETKKDSIELNRKNLISTTHWLINIDKRLTLKQAIPQIKYLQEKKENSDHKKQGAKNYFTCNDTTRETLGFIEFTNIIYHDKSTKTYANKISKLDLPKGLSIEIESINNIIIKPIKIKKNIKISNSINLKNDIIDLLKTTPQTTRIILGFNKHMAFQDYISIKSILKPLTSKNITISNNEYIY